MKRGNTRILNKRLQNIEERLLGPKLRPITVILINTFGLEENVNPNKARLCPQRQPVSRYNPLNIRIIENYNGENPLINPITQPQQNQNLPITIETIDSY